MASKTVSAAVSFRRHPSSRPDYPAWLAIVTTARGRCYFVTWAGDEPPAEAEVLRAWREDRKAFQPYHS